MVAPGETREQAVALEILPQQLPRSCAAGITSEAAACYTRVIPQPGNYTLTVRAAVLDCGPTANCDCNPDANGVCRNDIALAEPVQFDFPSASYYQNQGLTIGTQAP
jgi:hypothetical protein